MASPFDVFNVGENNLLTGFLKGFGSQSGSENSSKTGTQKKLLTQEGMDKLIYDVMSSDQGLAALAGGENMSGGFGSSTKTLLAQDLVTKIAGELANITAPTEITSEESTSQKTKKRPTVICTELNRQGLLSDELYGAAAAFKHYDKISYITLAGYHAWAPAVVEKMKTSPRLCKLMLPWVLSRYEWIVNRRRGLRGFLTIYVGQPVCFIIGLFVKGQHNGNVIT